MRKIKRKNQDQQKETKQRHTRRKNLDIVKKARLNRKTVNNIKLGV